MASNMRVPLLCALVLLFATSLVGAKSVHSPPNASSASCFRGGGPLALNAARAYVGTERALETRGCRRSASLMNFSMKITSPGSNLIQYVVSVASPCSGMPILSPINDLVDPLFSPEPHLGSSRTL